MAADLSREQAINRYLEIEVEYKNLKLPNPNDKQLQLDYNYYIEDLQEEYNLIRESLDLIKKQL